MATLLKVDPAEWAEAVAGQEEYLEGFGARLPAGIREEHLDLTRRVSDSMTDPELRGRDSGH